MLLTNIRYGAGTLWFWMVLLHHGVGLFSLVSVCYGVGSIFCTMLLVLVCSGAGAPCCWYTKVLVHYGAGMLWCWWTMVLVPTVVLDGGLSLVLV